VSTGILEELDIEGLRGAFLEYTREAYLSIPPIVEPRIVDVGCGTGQPTLELARLSSGEIVAGIHGEAGVEAREAVLTELVSRLG